MTIAAQAPQPSAAPALPDSAIVPTYARAKLGFERGEGAWLIAHDGRRYLDFAGGIAVSSLGHSHPHLVEALVDQARKVWHLSNLYQAPEGERFARRLADLTFADQVFFTNSGAEANEGAIKMARRYHSLRGEPERYRIVTFEGAFHGRTLATIAAGGQKKYLDGFGPPVDGFDQVPFGDHEALLAAITPATGAVLIEPIQGEGGIRPVPPQCLRGLRALCVERGLLLIYDEVQCGVGRTGKLFAHEWSGAAPDIMTIAKGIGGGFPMAALLATKEAATGLSVGVHGTTFGGGPLAMAVGNAVLDVVAEPAFLDHVARTGLALKQRLAELVDRHPRVLRGVRGEGLMLGLVCEAPSGDLVTAAQEEGVLTVGAGGNVVRLLPPLVIGDAEVAEAFDRLDRACARVEAALDAGDRAAA